MEKTSPSFKSLIINKNKPILICDADEVIFDFMHDFLIFLETNQLFFNWNSYALTGNIIRKNNKALNEEEVKKIISFFFKAHTLNMKLVNGAKSSLNKISKKFNIIILSNIPFEFYELRKSALKKNKLYFPFFTNRGEKGTPCSIISKLSNKQTWFIDDSPTQVSSVRKMNSNIKTILFIDNHKLAKLVKYKEDCDFYSTNWKKNEKILFNW